MLSGLSFYNQKAKILPLIMKTKAVINNKRRSVSLNVDREAWKKMHHMAYDKEVTITNLLEHLILEHANDCRHEQIPIVH
jgi:hypothetical protein